MYILTDGNNYVTYRNPDPAKTVAARGAVIITPDINKAYRFENKNDAYSELKRLPVKAKGFSVREAPEPETVMPAENTTARRQFTAETRKKVYAKNEGHCVYCGTFVNFDEFEIEHAIPLARGGTNDIDNLFPACHTCNSMKGSYTDTEFIAQAEKITATHTHDTDGSDKTVKKPAHTKKRRRSKIRRVIKKWMKICLQ